MYGVCKSAVFVCECAQLFISRYRNISSTQLVYFRTVRVVKLISEGTVDECMLQIANEKLKLEQITMDYNDIDDDESKASSSDTKDIDFGSLLKQAMDI